MSNLTGTHTVYQKSMKISLCSLAGVVQSRSMNQEGTVQFLDRAQAQVVGLIPSTFSPIIDVVSSLSLPLPL